MIRDGLSTIDKMQDREADTSHLEPVRVCGLVSVMLPVQRIKAVFGQPFSYQWFIPRPYGTLRRANKRRARKH